jgi:hypothetical protein
MVAAVKLVIFTTSALDIGACFQIVLRIKAVFISRINSKLPVILLFIFFVITPYFFAGRK